MKVPGYIWSDDRRMAPQITLPNGLSTTVGDVWALFTGLKASTFMNARTRYMKAVRAQKAISRRSDLTLQETANYQLLNIFLKHELPSGRLTADEEEASQSMSIDRFITLAERLGGSVKVKKEED